MAGIAECGTNPTVTVFIAIELRKMLLPSWLLNYLFKYTDLPKSLQLNMVASGTFPPHCSGDCILCKEIILTKRFDKARLRRLHIVEGLVLSILDNWLPWFMLKTTNAKRKSKVSYDFYRGAGWRLSSQLPVTTREERHAMYSNDKHIYIFYRSARAPDVQEVAW